MTITSKFNGNCKACGHPYKKGDQIEWTREEGTRHVSCPAARPAGGPSVPSAPVPPRPAQAPQKIPAPIPLRPAGLPATHPAPKPSAKEAAPRFHNLERVYHRVEQDAKRGAWTVDALRQLEAWPSLDALKAALALVEAQQQRVDDEYRLAPYAELSCVR